jgi:hypothetical protein
MLFHGPRLRTNSALNRLLNARPSHCHSCRPGSRRGDGAGFGQALGVAHGEVLHAAVGVVHQRAGVVPVALPGPQAHFSASRARSVCSVRSISTGTSRNCWLYRPGLNPGPATHDNLRVRSRPKNRHLHTV